jgi:rhodanese-related sulfurtransferase
MLQRRNSVMLIAGLSLILLIVSYPVMAADPVAVAVDEFLSTLPKDFYGLPPKGLQALLEAGEPITVIDVREVAEFEAGHIEGAVNLPIRQLARGLRKLPPGKNSPLAVICRSGARSSYGTMSLWLLGYRNLRNVSGGMLAWEKDGFPVVK